MSSKMQDWLTFPTSRSLGIPSHFAGQWLTGTLYLSEMNLTLAGVLLETWESLICLVGVVSVLRLGARRKFNSIG